MERTDHYYIRLAESKARRNRELRRNYMILTVAVIVVCVIIGLIISGMRTNAAEEHSQSYKYYTSVMIGYGENLNDVAARFVDYEHYDDLDDYLDEICSINHIAKVGKAHAQVNPGNYVVVPYYSNEFRK